MCDFDTWFVKQYKDDIESFSVNDISLAANPIL